MRRRGAALVCALVVVVATACGGGGGGSGAGGGDPMAPAATTTIDAARGGAPYGPPTVLGTVTDPVLDESSGLVASRRNPGLLWTHNDSGDDPFVYCLDMAAHSCGAWRVPGAEAFDWEDIAAGPGPVAGNAATGPGPVAGNAAAGPGPVAGNAAAGPGPVAGDPYLYLGDIGDNLSQRTGIVVYRIPEPVVTPGQVPTKAAPASTAPAEAIRLKYPDGPHNAEALLVHPVSGDLYVIVKDAQSAGVYKAKAPLDPSKVTTLAQIGSVRLGSASRGLELVTGADISPDGTRVAVVTYAQGYELLVPAGGPFDDVWAQTPSPIALGPRLQGESIAYRLDGRALLTTSEILPFQLQQVERRP